MGVRDESIVYFDGVLKILGVCHGVLGGLLVVFGIVVRVTVDHWTSVMLLSLWIGVIVSELYFKPAFLPPKAYRVNPVKSSKLRFVMILKTIIKVRIFSLKELLDSFNSSECSHLRKTLKENKV